MTLATELTHRQAVTIVPTLVILLAVFLALSCISSILLVYASGRRFLLKDDLNSITKMLKAINNVKIFSVLKSFSAEVEIKSDYNIPTSQFAITIGHSERPKLEFLEQDRGHDVPMREVSPLTTQTVRYRQAREIQ